MNKLYRLQEATNGLSLTVGSRCCDYQETRAGEGSEGLSPTSTERRDLLNMAAQPYGFSPDKSSPCNSQLSL